MGLELFFSSFSFWGKKTNKKTQSYTDVSLSEAFSYMCSFYRGEVPARPPHALKTSLNLRRRWNVVDKEQIGWRLRRQDDGGHKVSSPCIRSRLPTWSTLEQTLNLYQLWRLCSVVFFFFHEGLKRERIFQRGGSRKISLKDSSGLLTLGPHFRRSGRWFCWF